MPRLVVVVPCVLWGLSAACATASLDAKAKSTGAYALDCGEDTVEVKPRAGAQQCRAGSACSSRFLVKGCGHSVDVTCSDATGDGGACIAGAPR